jgi:hypothetical protein
LLFVLLRVTFFLAIVLPVLSNFVNQLISLCLYSFLWLYCQLLSVLFCGT